MRNRWCCVPMMILLLLPACGAGGGEDNEAEQLALVLRGEYLEMTACTATAEITADYGQRVYQYTMSVESAEVGSSRISTFRFSVISVLQISTI